MGKKTTAATTTGKRHSTVALACIRKSSKKKRIRKKKTYSGLLRKMDERWWKAACDLLFYSPITPCFGVGSLAQAFSPDAVKKNLLAKFYISNKERAIQQAEKKCEQQFRSNMNGVIKVVQDLQLTSSQTFFLSEFCPFWNLIKVIIDKKVTKQSTMKNYVDIANIVSCFDKESKSFHFAGNELWFTREDLIKVFGISGGNDPILLDTSKCKHVDKCVDSMFYKMNFKDVTRLTTGIVLRKLKRTAAKGLSKEDCTNLCQLMTLYFVTALFDPTKGSTLTWGYNKYIMVLSEIKRYDWAGYIYDKLHTSLCNYRKPQDVTGCVMALPFWIMENFEETAPRNPDAKLLCEKWDLSKLKVPITQVLEIYQGETQMIPCLNSITEIEGLNEGRNKDNSNNVENEKCSKGGDNELMIVESVNVDDAYWSSPLSTHVKILKEKINRNKSKHIVKENDNVEKTIDKISTQLKKLEGVNSRVVQLQADLCQKDAEISVLKNKVAEFHEMKAEYQRKDSKISQLEANVAQKDAILHEEISVWKEKEAEFNEMKAILEEESQRKDAEISVLKNKEAARFNEMKAEYQRKDGKILQLEADVAEKNATLHEEISVLKKKEAELIEMKAFLEEESQIKDAKILQLKADMEKKDVILREEISVLKKKEAEFIKMKAFLEEESQIKDAKILQLESDMAQKEARPFVKFFENN